MGVRFRDRRDAGRKLSTLLKDFAVQPDTLVLALPRGGVPVGFEVAQALGAPLDIFLVRKVGVPGREELAMGAIASGGLRVLNHDVIEDCGVPQQIVDAISRAELRELERREQAYRGERPAPDPQGRTVILVDDGLATGATMLAAVSALREHGARQIVVAVPVAPPSTLAGFRRRVDAVVCVSAPATFGAVGEWYDDFSQTSDDEVRQLLAAARAERERVARSALSREESGDG